MNKSGLPVADIVAKNTVPDEVSGVPPPKEIAHQEPTVIQENVNLLEEILQLKSAVAVLVQAVPLSEIELAKINIRKGDLS